MKVSFRQLQLFLALAETGSVSAAARRQHVTQPTASMQLREITEAVGIPLYEVISRRVRLTAMGEELAATARQISDAWSLFEQQAAAARGLTSGTLKVAVVSTAAYFMPRLIGAFCRAHPSVEIALEVLNRDGVVQRLRESRDDLYIMSMPPTDIRLDDTIFMSNPLVVIAATGDVRSTRKPMPLSALKGKPFILRENGSGTRMAVDRHFRAGRFQPEIRLQLGSNEAIKEAVAGGLGFGIISRHALHNDSGSQGIRVVNVEGFPIESQWHMVHTQGKRLPPIAEAFKQALISEARGGA
jgi:DNA-binding transcriptional LysR family regulator